MRPVEPSALDLAPRHLAELHRLLERHVPGAEVWAFGSRVTGGGHEGSDLDLVLRNPGDPREPVAGAADLQEALQASGLPMLVEVHDWACLPERFHAEIARRHVVVAAPRRREEAPVAAEPKAGDGPPNDFSRG